MTLTSSSLSLIELKRSSISFSIFSIWVVSATSFGVGRSLKFGGKTKGFFFITRNSSLFSYFFPLKASLTP